MHHSSACRSCHAKTYMCIMLSTFWVIHGGSCSFWHPEHGELTVCWPDTGRGTPRHHWLCLRSDMTSSGRHQLLRCYGCITRKMTKNFTSTECYKRILQKSSQTRTERMQLKVLKTTSRGLNRIIGMHSHVTPYCK